MRKKNIPLYIGEFNCGFNEGTIFTQEQISQYVKTFKKLGSCGWVLWHWSYIRDQKIPASNLTEFIDNRINHGINFTFFINALWELK